MFCSTLFSLTSSDAVFKQEELTQKYIADENNSRKRVCKRFPVYECECIGGAWIFTTFNLLRKSIIML